jgi:hypothetical protein
MECRGDPPGRPYTQYIVMKVHQIVMLAGRFNYPVCDNICHLGNIGINTPCPTVPVASLCVYIPKLSQMDAGFAPLPHRSIVLIGF